MGYDWLFWPTAILLGAWFVSGLRDCAKGNRP
jgi:hypothetical protein